MSGPQAIRASHRNARVTATAEAADGLPPVGRFTSSAAWSFPVNPCG